LPIECIKSFVFRPKRLRSEEFIVLKERIMERSERMIELGEKLKELHEDKKIKATQIKILSDFRSVRNKLK
jgi:hypothetical protein